MANVLEFRNHLYASPGRVGLLDGEVYISTPFQVPIGSEPKMRACSITISDRIPNIFNANPYYEFDNTRVRIWTNAVDSQIDIQLMSGLYPSAVNIADAINAAIASSPNNYYKDNTKPALSITSNLITDQIMVTIDSTKMKAPHNALTLDIRHAGPGSDLGTTLGFDEGHSVFVGTAGNVLSWTSSLEVRLDTQGTICDIQCSLVALRRRNDEYVRTLALVPFAGKFTVSDNVWPQAGQISPYMIYDGKRSIDYYQVEVKTTEGRPMLFMGGSIHIVIAFDY